MKILRTEAVAEAPIHINGLLHGHWAAQVLRSGVELDVFARLDGGPANATSLASMLSADPRALTALLDALVSIDLLGKTGGHYSLTEDSRTYLVPSSPLFLGPFIRWKQENDDMWRSLTATVRSGKPVHALPSDKEAQDFFPRLAEALFPMNYAFAQRLADDLQVAELAPDAKVLDVAAGAGTWSIPMALAAETLHVDALDFPAILEVTKKFAQRYGVADRYGYVAGNWRDIPWQRDYYDIVVLGNILHNEGRELGKALIQRCAGALKPGGRLVIADVIANDERSGPRWVMLFGVDMLMHTTESCVFTEPELSAMISESGLKRTDRFFFDGLLHSPVLVSRKPGR